MGLQGSVLGELGDASCPIPPLGSAGAGLATEKKEAATPASLGAARGAGGTHITAWCGHSGLVA